jgi:hypothetical protein
MFMSLHEPRFPRWIESDNIGKTRSLGDNCILETRYQYRKQENDITIDLSDGKYNIRFGEEGTLTLLKIQTGKSTSLRRETGWTFSYFFDRNFTFYLCKDEYIFPTSATLGRYARKNETRKILIDKIMREQTLTEEEKKEQIRNLESRDDVRMKKADINFQRMLILDGEIVQLVKTQTNPHDRYNYTIYDIVIITSEKQGQLQNNSLINCNMSTRKDAINKEVTDPHYWYYKALIRGQLPKIQFIRKHFYDKSSFDEVMGLIQPDPENPKHYIYKGYNLNDGLVFTPDSKDLYPFAQGTNQNLLKWKWPNRLTADFLVKVPGTEKPNIIENLNVYFFIQSKHLFYRQVKLSPPVTDPIMITKLRNVQPPGRVGDESGVIAEMMFEAASEAWSVELVREDKNHGNGFKVVSNTLENILENIDSNDLSSICNRNTVLKANNEQHDEFEKRVAKEGCYVYFRVFRNQDSYPIQFRANNRWNNYMELYDLVNQDHFYDDICWFFDDISDKDRTWYKTYDDFDQMFVKCVYVPHLGQYKIIEATQYDTDSIPSCNAGELLKKLEKMIVIRHKMSLEALVRTMEDGEEDGNSENGDAESNEPAQKKRRME